MKKVFLVASALLLVLTGCGATSSAPPPAASAVAEPPAPAPAPQPPAAKPAPTPSPVALQTKVVSLDSGNLFFSPSDFTFKVNQPVRVNYTNQGHHTFTVNELGVNVALDDASGSFTFTPKKTGTFSLYCAIPGHRDGGMEGTVTVL